MTSGKNRYYKLSVAYRFVSPQSSQEIIGKDSTQRDDLKKSQKLPKPGVPVAVLYLDECEVQLLPVIRAMWLKGARLRVPTPGQNVKRAIFGALDARTGVLHHLIRPRKRAADFTLEQDHDDDEQVREEFL